MNGSCLEPRALEIWNVVRSAPVAYDWPIGETVRHRLNALLGRELECWTLSDQAKLNRGLRESVGEVLRDPHTPAEKAGALYAWIVADWGRVRAGPDVVRGWAEPGLGWHGDYSDATLMSFADDVGLWRVASWSKVFAFAAPDRHAIYDSRVAVTLNLALERLGETDRFVMPPSKIYRNKQRVERPNAVARARTRLLQSSPKPTLGYRDYLRWLTAVRFQTSERGGAIDFLEIESTAFAAAPSLALDEHR